MTGNLRFKVEATYWSGDPLERYALAFELQAPSADLARAEVLRVLAALGKIEPAATATPCAEHSRQVEYFGVPVAGLVQLNDLVDRT